MKTFLALAVALLALTTHASDVEDWLEEIDQHEPPRAEAGEGCPLCDCEGSLCDCEDCPHTEHKGKRLPWQAKDLGFGFEIKENVQLEQPLRLDFSIIPDPEGKALSVSTATSTYSVSIEIDEEERFVMWIGGELEEREGGAVLLNFDTEIAWNEDGHEGVISANGSVVAQPGETKTLARFGEYQLQVRVSAAE